MTRTFKALAVCFCSCCPYSLPSRLVQLGAGHLLWNSGCSSSAQSKSILIRATLVRRTPCLTRSRSFHAARRRPRRSELHGRIAMSVEAAMAYRDNRPRPSSRYATQPVSAGLARACCWSWDTARTGPAIATVRGQLVPMAASSSVYTRRRYAPPNAGGQAKQISTILRRRDGSARIAALGVITSDGAAVSDAFWQG